MLPFVLPPLVNLAVSMVPGLAKRVADNVLPGVEGKITKVVTDFLGTDDPAVAEEKLLDPKVASELRVRLAEIEVEASKVEAEDREKERQAQLEAMKVELQTFSKQVEDTQNARSTMTDLAGKRSPLAWGPVVVSGIVVLGFFIMLRQLLNIPETLAGEPPAIDDSVLQVVNIAFGALTAGFATVISFWLGSSEGSRQKDANALVAQTTAADVQRTTAQATQRLVESQTQQTENLVTRMAQPQMAQPMVNAAAPAGQSGLKKDPRQFHKCVEIILAHEGGFANNPQDPGGATNMGITHRTLAAWRKIDAVTADEVEKLDVEEAKAIYRANYWNALNCDQLPAGIDLVTFDFGVNAGPSRSAKMLQKVLSVEGDGQVGPVTVGAARISDPSFVIATFSDDRLKYYQALDGWPTFGDGWSRRTSSVREAALDMARVARG